MGGLSCVHSKSQQLWLLRSVLDRGEACSDELLVAWLFQVQQLDLTKIKGTHECLANYRPDQRQLERNL